MADIAMQAEIAAPPADVYRALTSTEGVAGWWTTRNETSGVVGTVQRFWFPDAPMSWDLEVTSATPDESLIWHCVGGPPEWIGTQVRWTLQPGETGTVVLLDHTGFEEVGTMYRIVTFGWAQMLERMQRYLSGGTPVPYFDQEV